MSRCFPFPPPGYEKKTRVDDSDLLAKEKHKEKKHKKDKKHKEKKEDKDKKDKDRSKEKHREKKHRKEKHKDKEKEGDKEKNGVEGQTAHNNGQKVSSSSVENNEIKDSKFVQEFAKRIRNDSGVSPASQMVQKIAPTDQKRAEPRVMSFDGSLGNQSKEKEKSKGDGEDRSKANGQRNLIEAKDMEKNFAVIDKHRAEETAKLAEKKKGEKPIEGKEKKHKESKGDKHRDQDKGSKSKNKEKDKEKKKEERVKEIRQPGKDQILKESKSSLDFGGVVSPDPWRLRGTTLGSEGTVRKHNEIEGEIFKEFVPRLRESNKDALEFRNIKTPSPSKLGKTAVISEGTIVNKDPFEFRNIKTPSPSKLSKTAVISEGTIVNKDPFEFRNIKTPSPLKLSKTAVISEGTIVKHKELEGQVLKESVPKLKGSNKDSLDFRITKTSEASKLGSTTFRNEGILGKRKELDDRGLMMKESNMDSPEFLNIKASDSSKLSSTTFSNEGTLGKRNELDDGANKLKESNKNSLDFRNNMIPVPLKSSSTTCSSEGTLGKRKELEVNGHLLDNGHRPSKLPRPLPTPDSAIQNGRKSEPFGTSIQLSSGKQEAVNGKSVEIKEHKINGFITAEQLNPSSGRTPPAKLPAIPKKETVKLPHPDTKYLGQILSVPERVDLPDFCDQDWLFNGTQPSKKPRRDSPVVDGTKEVWAEALRIESAEISALPYVIPY
ncbi:hypothetical protein LINPERHAP2_LOCUS6188 [Linum perenne]